MEELKENKSIVTSYRLTQDTKDKLQQQLKDLGLTQEQYFNKVVSLMELENVKQNSFLSKDTTVIQSNLDAILKAFVSVADSSNNLISNKDIELEELKIKYKDMLYTKENIITSKSEELQNVYSNLSVLQLESDNNRIELDKIKVENIKSLEQLESSLKDKNLIVEEYKQKNDMLLSNLQEYKQFKEQMEQYKVLLSDAQSKNITLDNSIKDKDTTINNLTISIETVKAQNKQDIEQLKRELEFNKNNAILEIKQEQQKQMQEINNKHNAEIETYQNKYKTLLEQMDKTTTSKKIKDAAVRTDK